MLKFRQFINETNLPDDWHQPKTAFHPDFMKKWDDAQITSDRNRGRLMNPVDGGTVRDAFNKGFVDHLPKPVLSARIRFATNVNGEHFSGFGHSRDLDGNHHIVINPNQVDGDKVRGMFHELQHACDRNAGGRWDSEGGNQGLSDIDRKAYLLQPQERRARRAERTGKIIVR